MRSLTLIAIALLGGCKKNFYTVEEACDDEVPGAKKIESDEAIEHVLRANCYRRVVKLNQGRLDPIVQEGVEKHLDYIIQNGVLEAGLDWTIEDPTMPGYTGVDVYERMEALDYIFEDVSGWGVWELAFWGTPFTPEELVDYLYPDPNFRQMILQPDWIDAGYAEAEDLNGLVIGHGTIFYSYPSIEREERPIVYPRDGQLDVPYSFHSTQVDSIATLGGVVGFPITITFSNSLASAFDPAAINPYDVAFKSASLSSASGPVELVLISPPGLGEEDILRYTLVAVPIEPLEPDTEYTFEAEVTWSQDQRKTLTSVFTTSKTLDFRTRVLTGVNARSVPQVAARHLPLVPR